jgi:hypothetical protein
MVVSSFWKKLYIFHPFSLAQNLSNTTSVHFPASGPERFSAGLAREKKNPLKDTASQ